MATGAFIVAGKIALVEAISAGAMGINVVAMGGPLIATDFWLATVVMAASGSVVAVFGGGGLDCEACAAAVD